MSMNVFILARSYRRSIIGSCLAVLYGVYLNTSILPLTHPLLTDIPSTTSSIDRSITQTPNIQPRKQSTKMDPEPTIPIVDFANWNTPTTTPSQKLSIAKQLTDACRNVGFVYIINHQIPGDLIEEAFGWAKKLFDLSMEEKMLAPHPDGPAVHRGYSWPGLEKVSQVLAGEGEDVVDELRKVRDCKV